MRFIFFDHVLELEPGKRILATKAVGFDGEYFSSHYQGRPIMPATLMVEAIAQSAGWLNFITHEESIRMVVALVEGVKFRRSISPGELLMLEAKVLFLHPGGATMGGQARVGSEVVTTVERMVFANQKVDPALFTPRELRHYHYIKAGTRTAGAQRP